MSVRAAVAAVLLATLVPVLVIAAGTGSGRADPARPSAAEAPPPEAPPPEAPSPTVKILDDEFASPRVEVQAGAAVIFDQQGRHAHTITADGGGFDTGNLPPGEKLRVQFPAAGVYRYHCSLHGAPGGRGMSALVVVDGAPTPPGPEPRTPRPQGPATIRVPGDQ
ncbi:MAG: cupredoxin domain-containing protein, partial [Actinomycetota bacterium]